MIARKLAFSNPSGLAKLPKLTKSLFPHQIDLIGWSLRRGRAAIFAQTGLGKTRMWAEWAARVPGNAIVLTPLAVAEQSLEECAALGHGKLVRVCESQSEVETKITITNYEKLHRFDPSSFEAVVLDESSCIKHHDAKTLRILLEAFRSTPWKLCTTATPAPNDWTELGTHAEFLGVCSRAEMLAEFFVHDGGETQKWRLKGHARAQFWRWVSSWGALVRKPSDLGYSDEGYDLPPLRTHEHIVKSDRVTNRDIGMLFVDEARTLAERRAARRESLSRRVMGCASIVNDSCDSWIVWCDLNDESDELTRAIPGAVEVRGSMDSATKTAALIAFSRGERRVIVTKPSIAGFGLNWQHCSHQAFVGLTDSWEAYYQAVRRSWRFGQKREVNVHLFVSELEGAVLANLQRKEADAETMAAALAAETRAYVQQSVRGLTRETNEYAPTRLMSVPNWMNEVSK